MLKSQEGQKVLYHDSTTELELMISKTEGSTGAMLRVQVFSCDVCHWFSFSMTEYAELGTATREEIIADVYSLGKEYLLQDIVAEVQMLKSVGKYVQH